MFYYLFDKAGELKGPVALPVTPGVGVQLPSNAVELSFKLPLPEKDRTWALVDNVPREVVDRRGVVYHKASGRQQVWSELGELPEAFTTDPCPGEHYVWADDKWQIDRESQLSCIKAEALSKRDVLLRDAMLRIAPLQYAEDIGDASDEEQLALMEWRLYSVELNRIHKQAAFPDEINWPVVPASTV